jgi:hypothetical protein
MRYKISESNLNGFFKLFGKKKEDRADSINDLIAKDPVLQKIDKAIGDLNDKAAETLKKDKWATDILKKYGIDIK